LLWSGTTRGHCFSLVVTSSDRSIPRRCCRATNLTSSRPSFPRPFSSSPPGARHHRLPVRGANISENAGYLSVTFVVLLVTSRSGVVATRSSFSRRASLSRPSYCHSDRRWRSTVTRPRYRCRDRARAHLALQELRTCSLLTLRRALRNHCDLHWSRQVLRRDGEPPVRGLRTRLADMAWSPCSSLRPRSCSLSPLCQPRRCRGPVRPRPHSPRSRRFGRTQLSISPRPWTESMVWQAQDEMRFA